VFNRNTLTSGTSTALSLLQGRSTSRQVFSLDYRFYNGAAQVRAVMTRSTGLATTNWVSLATGKHTLQVDWVGATQGSLRLSIDGVGKVSLTGNTSALRIDTAWLGVSAGMNSSSKGTAYFDSFVSNRFTMP
jgi:hypothetical protein